MIKYLYLPNSIDSLCRSFKFIIKNHIKYYIISGGSNVLATDEYFDGVVILLKSMPSGFQLYSDTLVVDAFYPTAKLGKELAKLGVSNLGFLANIPGLIGGAIKQNSGCFKSSVGEHLISCKYIDEYGIIKEIKRKDLDYSYRKSVFSKIRGIIIEATFEITKQENIVELIENQTKLKKQNQPIATFNMGCVFKNGANYKAWKVIDDLGFRGYNINDAYVSDKHTNFIINKGHANFDDVMKLINLIKQKASERYSINLEYEINTVV